MQVVHTQQKREHCVATNCAHVSGRVTQTLILLLDFTAINLTSCTSAHARALGIAQYVHQLSRTRDRCGGGLGFWDFGWCLVSAVLPILLRRQCRHMRPQWPGHWRLYDVHNVVFDNLPHKTKRLSLTQH